LCLVGRQMPKAKTTNETIAPAGFDKVALLGQDGLKGIATITGKIIILNAILESRYHIALHSDGTIDARIYRTGRITPIIKLSGVHAGDDSFSDILEDVWTGRRSVHRLFSGLISNVITDMEEYQDAFLARGDAERYLTLEAEKSMLKKLRYSLLKSGSEVGRAAISPAAQASRASGPGMLIERAVGRSPGAHR
jgi:hypothetical protein